MASKSKLDQAAGASIGGFFSNAGEAPKQPQTATKTKKANISPQLDEKAVNEPQAKRKKQVFSFRAWLDDISVWKAYATATGQTMETVGTAAMNEYIDRHELTGKQKAAFDALKE